MGKYILVIDQGTTSSRTIIFDAGAAPVATTQEEFTQHYPHPGWIEHDPEDLWQTTLSTARGALRKSQLDLREIAGIGITNQRETTIVWDRKTGVPIYNAIVWQDRRTFDICAGLSAGGHDELVRQRTGLIIDPYFSATKIAWILDHVDGARARAELGELAFGTVDTFLLWRFTDGAVHATDATNAARTSLLDIHTCAWDADLLRLFRVPESLLPEVRDTAGTFGTIATDHLGVAIPVLAMAGDQQSALIGQACLQPGMAKATYGTGGFILLNTGATAVRSTHRLLTTIAYQWQGKRHYALEGSIFSAGATVQWLRDALGIISSAAEAGALAAEADQEQQVYLVPAFAGLGAPYWSSEARGTLVGLTRGTTRKELSRAALESVGFQTRDLLSTMYDDASTETSSAHIIRVDGGMTASDWTMQFLADILDASIDRPVVTETTALGVGLLAGWQAGLYPSPDDFCGTWKLERRFAAQMSEAERAARWAGWRDAVARTLLDTGRAP